MAGPDSYDSLQAYFKGEFLTEKNRIMWKRLGMAIPGAALTAAVTGVVNIPIAIRAAIEKLFGPVITAIQTESSGLANTIASVSEGAWQAPEFELVTLPVALALFLIVALVFAWGWDFATS